MIALYTTRKLTVTIAMVAVSIFLKAQIVEHLNANHVNAGFGIGANPFTLMADSNAFHDDTFQTGMLEVPANSGRSTMFTSALWMSGLDAGGNAICAAHRFFGGGRDFYDGPIVAVYDSLYDNFYQRVFKVTRTQINQLRALPPPLSNSQIDTAILMWPARGNYFVQAKYGVTITSHLAPFIDVDADQVYNPLNGDYPDICSDEAIFFVFNDERGYHHETGSSATLGMEIRGMAEVFIDTALVLPSEKRALNNTVFITYEVQNKSGNNYTDFYLGLWEDADLGCFWNDRVGCDTVRNMMFAYNDTGDTDCAGVLGYDPLRISQGTILLNRDISAFGYHTNGAIASQTDPGMCLQYRNYLQGLWNDGFPFTNAGTGYNNGTPTKFLFPGDPNNPNDWTDRSSGAPAGDRRIFGSMGPMSFNAGETKYYDFAFTTAYDSTATHLTIVDTLKRDADIIQDFYNTQLGACKLLGRSIGMGVGGGDEQMVVSVFPNPASDLLHITFPSTAERSIALFDVEGRLLQSQTTTSLQTVLNLSTCAAGLYIVRVNEDGKQLYKKVMKL